MTDQERKTEHLRMINRTFLEALDSIIEFGMHYWDLWITLDYQVAAWALVAPETVKKAYPGAKKVGTYDRNAVFWTMWDDVLNKAREEGYI